MYYIRKITIISDTGTVSELLLEPGLNIVYGPSNTGKSLICECIDFMYGGDAKKLKKPSLKIRALSFELDVEGKTLQLYRELTSNKVVVSGDSILHGTYTTNNKGSKKTPALNELWLNLLGIEDQVEIYRYQNKKRQHLTVRTFIHSYIINETRMVGENSILKSEDGYNKNIPVSTITSLLYLATENNFIPEDEQDYEDDEIISAKKIVAKRLVDLSISALAESNYNSIQVSENVRSVHEIQGDINELLETIEATEEMLHNALSRNQDLSSQLLEIDNKLAEYRMLKNRYASLRTQYESDIRRLTFIAEGDIHKQDIPEIKYCPFCNGELEKEQSDSCIEAAISEVRKIKLQIDDLRSADNALDSELKTLLERKETMVNQRREVQSIIRGELRPKVESLRSELHIYTVSLERAKAAELMDSFVNILNEKMNEVIDENDTDMNVKFDVRAIINQYLKEPLEKRLDAILRSCNYDHFLNVRFDEESCDAVVNGSEKLTQGKGFRAFLNTVMAIALQEILDKYNKHKLPLMVIDSPILSLKEREEEVGTEKTSTSMRSGLFQYMIDKCQCRQTIVLENEIPNLNYENVNLIKFTKDEYGRYGLINGYKE